MGIKVLKVGYHNEYYWYQSVKEFGYANIAYKATIKFYKRCNVVWDK